MSKCLKKRTKKSFTLKLFTRRVICLCGGNSHAIRCFAYEEPLKLLITGPCLSLLRLINGKGRKKEKERESERLLQCTYSIYCYCAKQIMVRGGFFHHNAPSSSFNYYCTYRTWVTVQCCAKKQINIIYTRWYLSMLT